MSKLGQRTKLTEAVVKVVGEAIRAGLPYKFAALKAGICEKSFHNYRVQGEQDEEAGEFTLAVQFLHAVRRANLEFVAEKVGQINDAALKHDGKPGQWTAAAWLLERRFTSLFGRQKVELSGPDGGPVRLSVAESDEMMAALDRAGKVAEANASSNGSNGR